MNNTNSEASAVNNRTSNSASKFSLLVIVLAIALILLGSLGIYIFWQNSRPVSVLTVSGEASGKYVPNVWLFGFSIEERGETIQINQIIDQKTAQIINYLQQEVGIPKESIKTSKSSRIDYEYYSRYSPETKDAERTRRVLKVSFVVRLENLENPSQKVNPILAKLFALGLSDIDWSSYDISDSECKRIYEELLLQAIDDANRKAEKQLQKIGAVQIVNKELHTGYNTCHTNKYPRIYQHYTHGLGGGSNTEPKRHESGALTLPGEGEIASAVVLRIYYR